jgi:hypothetical protein
MIILQNFLQLNGKKRESYPVPLGLAQATASARRGSCKRERQPDQKEEAKFFV